MSTLLLQKKRKRKQVLKKLKIIISYFKVTKNAVDFANTVNTTKVTKVSNGVTANNTTNTTKTSTSNIELTKKTSNTF